MAEIELRNVWKIYGKNRAVQGASFTCPDKTLTAILGPSGAGKTSILKMIAGIEPITHGQILMDGQSIDGFEPEELNVAMVFESYALYPNISVFENIAFPLRAPIRAKQFTENDIREKVEKAAKTLQIETLLKRRPKELSGGQRQRVALGRALVRNPRVLLMDEPIAHLDAKLRNKMRGELRTLTHSLETTIIYVTHDYREALAIADNIITINKGVIQQIASPEEIFAAPASDFVADLVGDPPMNLIDCQFIEKGGEQFLTFENVCVKIDEKNKGRVKAFVNGQSKVRLGVRPIHVKFSEPLGDNELIPAEVYVVEPLGRINIITLKVGEGTLIQSVVSAGIRPKVSAKVGLSFSNIHIFEPSVDFQNAGMIS